ncbi:MAG: hypothetical protein J6T55_02810 [Alphaproteobacteria bacterium]|nr:hypothetical protein [Alphaproteobacteria bacterium]
MSKKHSESGRSLLEIVVVLGIVALLMIITSLGYSFISLKYREKESVKQVSELAVRYKLNPVKPKEGKKRIPLKTIYPEAVLTEASEALVTPDTTSTRVYLQPYEETSAFSIVVNQTLPGTCEELLESGEYDMVVFKEGVSIEEALTTQGETEKNAFSRDYLMSPEGKELIQKICAQEKETKKVTGLGLVFDKRCPGLGKSFWYRGQCWNCPITQVQDIHGACCSSLNECGVCRCPNGACKTETKTCVECVNDANCANNSKGHRCDTTTNKCVSCLADSDCAEGSYCTSGHTCVQCDTLDEKKHLLWNSKTDECECAKPLLALGQDCEEETNCCGTGLTCHEGICNECWEHKGPQPKVGACNSADFPICKPTGNGANKCERCPQTPTAIGDECYEVCGGCSAAVNLTCDTTRNQCVCSDNLHWNGVRCVECTENSHCPTGTTCSVTGSCEGCTANSSCPSCQALDPTKPYWDGTKCIECFANGPEGGCVDPTKPRCNLTTNVCEPCPTTAPNWDGTKCVECVNNSHCPVGKTCDITNSCKDCAINSSCPSCLALDPTKPYWDGTKCIECFANGPEGGCVDPTKPRCNLTTNVCEPCPTTAPNWDGTKCVECSEPSHCPAGKTCNSSNSCEDCAINSSCPSCLALDPEKPYWDGTQCIGCSANGPAGGCTEEKPVCNKETKVCEPCPAETPNWNGLRCLECFSHSHCADRTDGRVTCDINSHMCIECPDNASGVPTDQRIGLTACYCRPGYVVNSIGTKCVENCFSDVDCAGRTDGSTSCDLQTHRCVSCPEGYFMENGSCKTCGTDRNCVCNRYGLSPWTAGASCGKGKSLYVTFEGYLILDKDVTEIGQGQGCRTGTLTLTSEETGEVFTIPAKGYSDAYKPFKVNLKKGVYKAVLQTNHAKGMEFCYPSYDSNLGYAAMCTGKYYKVCPKGTFLDTGSNMCVNCLSDYGTGEEGACANLSKPWCNPSSNSCEACSANKPYWNTARRECVECMSDAHCANRTDGKTICDTSTNLCFPKNNPYHLGQTIFESETPNTYYVNLYPGIYDIVIVGAGGGNRGIREKHNHNSGTGASGGSGAGFVGTITVTKAKNNVAVHVGKGGKYKFTDQCCVGEKATDGEASSISGIISCPGGMAGSVQSDYNQATAGTGGSACTISGKVVSSLIKKAGSTGHTGSAKKSGNLTAVPGTTSVVSNFVPNNNGGTPGFCAGWWMNGMYEAGQHSCGSGLTNTSMTDSPSGYVKIIYKGN